mmetsp:Transcript_62403/g.122760  ORF Transcript_62403/g.122760 Transcript_62403/m.122760 type:complete len:209 (-) Transcript_62403:953-1579(-)
MEVSKEWRSSIFLTFFSLLICRVRVPFTLYTCCPRGIFSFRQNFAASLTIITLLRFFNQNESLPGKLKSARDKFKELLLSGKPVLVLVLLLVLLKEGSAVGEIPFEEFIGAECREPLLLFARSSPVAFTVARPELELTPIPKLSSLTGLIKEAVILARLDIPPPLIPPATAPAAAATLLPISSISSSSSLFGILGSKRLAPVLVNFIL